MFNNGGNSYKVTIPFFASKEVIDWFENLEKQGRLSEEIIGLVNAQIKNNKVNEKKEVCQPEKSSRNITISSSIEDQGDLIDGLYNWQDAAGALFTEQTNKEKVKKKMLQV